MLFRVENVTERTELRAFIQAGFYTPMHAKRNTVSACNQEFRQSLEVEWLLNCTVWPIWSHWVTPTQLSDQMGHPVATFCIGKQERNPVLLWANSIWESWLLFLCTHFTSEHCRHRRVFALMVLHVACLGLLHSVMPACLRVQAARILVPPQIRRAPLLPASYLHAKLATQNGTSETGCTFFAINASTARNF